MVLPASALDADVGVAPEGVSSAGCVAADCFTGDPAAVSVDLSAPDGGVFAQLETAKQPATNQCQASRRTLQALPPAKRDLATYPLFPSAAKASMSKAMGPIV